MIIHCTRKMAKKLPEVSPIPLQEDSPLGSWHANLYQFKHRQCVLFCHDISRYILFLTSLRKPQFAALGDWFLDIFTATLQAEGFEQSAIAQVTKSIGPIRFDTATNRSVLGSTRIVSDQVWWICQEAENANNLDEVAISLNLSHRPSWIMKKPIWPDRVMAEMVMTLQAGGNGH